MRLRFHKMHGLGNDFVVIDARETPAPIEPAMARALADRHTGIGCDQLIVIERADKADVFMRVFNGDGSEVESCGNAARCVTQLIANDATIDTAGGIIHGRIDGDGAIVEMGEPRFGWEEIPLAHAIDTAPIPAGWEGLERPYAVNVGNPHLVFFVDDVDAIVLEKLGPEIEHDPLFPEGINVNVASLRDHGLALRVWERGAGLTRACGTGACASAVAAIKYRGMRSPVAVHLPGGSLKIEWVPGEQIVMSGPAKHVFSAEIDTEALI